MLLNRRTALAALLALGVSSAGAAEAARPVVAVFALQSKGTRLKAEDLDRLSDYIGASLTESGRFLVVPREELKQALARQKADTFKQCYAQSCQIEVGKELAAEKSLAGSVSKFGKSCLVTLTLFDLAKATQEAAGTAKGACGEDAVLESVDEALKKLTGSAPRSLGAVSDTGRGQSPPSVVTPQIQGADYGDLEAEIQAAAAKAAREAAERKAREAAAERDWAKIEKYVRSDRLGRSRRVQILEKFLSTFAQDNPRELEARELLSQLRSGDEMVSVPGGSFLYGCNKAVDTECETDEPRAASTYVKGFMIDRYEATVADYRKCVNAGRCKKPKADGKCNWGRSGKDRHPINCISWAEAKTYCEWAGKRLPTEREWEKAARGTDGRKYAWGNTPVSCAYAVVKDQKNGCNRDETWPVGSKPKGASPYGAHDMLGNVWEWTADAYTHKGATGKRATRGGSYSDLKKYARVSNRLGGRAEAQFQAYGVRCVK